MLPTSPTDPLEVLCENAVKAIRRHVAKLHAEVAAHQFRNWDDAPATGYTRPTRTGWGV